MIIKRPVSEKGQVVIPKDIRGFLGIREKSNVVFEIENNEVKLKSEQEVDVFLKEFFSIARSKKNPTLKDIHKFEEESYDLP